jgi:single-stranded-DNA-specific exonuclease
MLLKGGGHAMAAGVTLKHGAIAEFRAYLERELAAGVAVARADQALFIDGAVSAGGANVELISTLSRAGPFGAGNAEPVIVLPAHTIAYAEEVGQAHVRARLRSGDGAMLNAIAFRAVGQPIGNALLKGRGQQIHTAGTLSIDRWNGSERAQLRIMDLASSDPAQIRASGTPD